MKPIISKEELEKIMNVKGEIRGLALKNYGKYILRENKKEGLKKLEEAMLSLGCPIKYEKLKAMAFYPLWGVLSPLYFLERFFITINKNFKKWESFVLSFPIL